MPQRLVLIDGHALAYRAFFAMPKSFITRNGELTNATWGFTRKVIDLITAAQPPDYLAVSFDVGKTFRDDLFPEYKGTREKMPEELGRQIERLHDVLDALNIPILEVDGYEADDVLGTIARIAGTMGLETVIVTGDRDLLQLVDEHTIVELPGKPTDMPHRAEDVVARLGVRPDQVVDYKALVGDTSDNIPGVPGVGEKTAIDLLTRFDTLDNIYANLDQITAKKARAALEANKESAYLSQKLARIITDVPLDFDLESCRTREIDLEKAVALFNELEFNSMANMLRSSFLKPEAQPGQQMSMFDEPAAPAGSDASEGLSLVDSQPTDTTVVMDEATLSTLVAALKAAPIIAWDCETDSLNYMEANLIGFSFSVEKQKGWYIPVAHSGPDATGQLPLGVLREALAPVLRDPAIPKVGHNAKFDAIVMAQHGMPVEPIIYDTMVGEWLVASGQSGSIKSGLKRTAASRLDRNMVEIETLIGKRGKAQKTFDQVPLALAAPYASADADVTLQILPMILADLEKLNLTRLFLDVEMPLLPVLIEMEWAGVLVDLDLLKQFSVETTDILSSLAEQIYAIAGAPFNINSTQQLSAVLFDQLRLEPPKGARRTQAGGYSTASGILDEIEDPTGIVALIQQQRELEKLRSTYLDALPTMVNKRTGRIHTQFNQVGTATGRISSSDPNLQNIPIRSEQGRRIRDAFIAPPGSVLIDADYSQIELRIMAHVSGDEALQQAFRDDLDIHAATAAKIYNVPLAEVSSTQRSFAKAVNFGLLYGMGPQRLARGFNLTTQQAKEFIEQYFAGFPRIRAYLDETKRKAIEDGYVETLMGRRRAFPILQQAVTGGQAAMERAQAEREAINMPIQGAAADIMKVAMIKLHKAIKARGLDASILLQIHDELLIEAHESEAEEVRQLVEQEMMNAYPLAVPLKVEARMGRSWGETK